MKRIATCTALFLALMSASVRAERPTTGLGLDSVVSPGELKATPEMWFYDQAMRNYKDPQMMVRAKADFRAKQRERRLESMKWYGLSNIRPRAGSDPFHSDYSPGWVANSGYYPWRWNGVAQP